MAAVTRTSIPALLEKLTLEEKASLCSGENFWNTQSIERLGIPAITVTDGPHGVRLQRGAADHVGLNDSEPATCFPTASGLGSSWSTDLMAEIGEALGKETSHYGVSVLLGPGINMKRSPLCGRNFEYFSEDPFHTGKLATELVKGIQGQGVGTSLKHFAANNQETSRMTISAEIDDRTLREIYLAAFERVVKEAQPWTVMCSYNKINGVAAAENHWLLTEVLRDDWGYDGLVVSDWGAVSERVEGVRAGLDLEMPSTGGKSDAQIVEAVKSGKLSEEAVDQVVTRILTLVAQSLENSTPAEVDFEVHHQLARKAATQTAVLLKNEKKVLPLTDTDSTVILGEMARTPRYQGAGSSKVNPTKLVSALDSFKERGVNIKFAPGYALENSPVADGDDAALRAEAVKLAEGKTAVIFAGLPASYESEGYDREHLQIPASHRQLIAKVRDVAKSVVVVLSNGSAVQISDWDDQADAILELWLGGQAGGEAAVDLLLGEVAPSGHLAESIPLNLNQVSAQLNFPGENGAVRYGEGIFIGYRGLDKTGAEVSYPFGHGLTYTDFAYSNLTVKTQEITRETALDTPVLQVSVTVTNTGEVTGTAVPQLYLGRPQSSIARAPRELKGFTRLELAAQESADISFEVTLQELSHWDSAIDDWNIEAGALEIMVGNSSRDAGASTTVSLVAKPKPHPVTVATELSRFLSIEGFQQKFAELCDLPLDSSVGADPEMAALMGGIPLGKVASMGVIPGLGTAEVETLVAWANDQS